MALPVNIDELLNGNTVEWDRIELKKGWNPEKILHSICAFANDFNNHDGGYIIVGVEEDNGVAKLPPHGLEPEQMDAIQKKLVELSFKIAPHYVPVSHPYLIENKHILVIWAPAGDLRPYKVLVSLSEKSAEKAWYVKRGSKTIKVKDGSEDERRLLELTARIPFDDRINHEAGLDDLDLKLIQAYLRQIKSALYQESSKISFKELCTQMKIVKGPAENIKPTNAGLLLFNENPEAFFNGARIDLVIHKGTVGKNYIEKVFKGPVHYQIRDVLDYFKSNILEEVVSKSDKKAEAVRFYNYPYQAIEEALVNAVYHKSYERPNPVEIQILDNKVEILNFPGPMPPVDRKMLQEKKRIITREYRNRKLGDYFKELKLTEGRGTGLPIIYDSMEKNGSPMPVFETDEDRSFFLCMLFAHPLANVNLGQSDDLSRNEDKTLKFIDLSDINPYLSLSVSDLRDRDIEAIRNSIDPKARQVLQFCVDPKSRDEIFVAIGLYKNTKNFKSHIKPLIDAGWLQLTLPDKLTSREQQYFTTDLGKQLLKIITSPHRSGIEGTSLASSNIASVEYDGERMIMEIEFHDGAVYQFFDVPEKVYLGLVNAPSHGAYYLLEVKELFKNKKIK
jgi:ATP-dependent DNA helicase RecG